MNRKKKMTSKDIKKVKSTQKHTALIITATIMIGFFIFILVSANKNKLQLSIGGEQITEEEFTLAMNDEKYDVSKYFFKEYGAEVDKDFWTKDIGSEAPYKKIADNAIDSLLYVHANYELAKENGYITDSGYDALLERYTKENEERARKIENNEPVYGLKVFPLDLFIEYEMDALQKIYINEQSTLGTDITTEEGLAYYDENKDKSFTKYDDLNLEYIKIRYDLLELDEDKVNKIEKDIISIYKDLDENISIEQNLENDLEYLKEYFHKEEIKSEEISAKSRDMDDIFELSNNLKEGESTQVINQNETLYLIRIIDKVENDYLPYEQVKDNIYKALREINFENMVQEKMQEMEIVADMDNVYSFAKKALENE